MLATLGTATKRWGHHNGRRLSNMGFHESLMSRMYRIGSSHLRHAHSIRPGIYRNFEVAGSVARAPGSSGSTERRRTDGQCSTLVNPVPHCLPGLPGDPQDDERNRKPDERVGYL